MGNCRRFELYSYVAQGSANPWRYALRSFCNEPPRSNLHSLTGERVLRLASFDYLRRVRVAAATQEGANLSFSAKEKTRNTRMGNCRRFELYSFVAQGSADPWRYALRSFYNEPPRSNLRVARLCKHRLAYARLSAPSPRCGRDAGRVKSLILR